MLDILFISPLHRLVRGTGIRNQALDDTSEAEKEMESDGIASGSDLDPSNRSSVLVRAYEKCAQNRPFFSYPGYCSLGRKNVIDWLDEIYFLFHIYGVAMDDLATVVSHAVKLELFSETDTAPQYWNFTLKAHVTQALAFSCLQRARSGLEAGIPTWTGGEGKKDWDLKEHIIWEYEAFWLIYVKRDYLRHTFTSNIFTPLCIYRFRLLNHAT